MSNGDKPTGAPREHASILDVAKVVATLGLAIGILYGAGSWAFKMTTLLATKEYHIESQDEFSKQLDITLAPIQKSIENTETSATVIRIQNILDLRCASQIPDAIEAILQEQMTRYHELTGRIFNPGGCKDGERTTNFPARTDSTP
jgi:hypothetical protein